jgi:hypothetical protein
MPDGARFPVALPGGGAACLPDGAACPLDREVLPAAAFAPPLRGRGRPQTLVTDAGVGNGVVCMVAADLAQVCATPSTAHARTQVTDAVRQSLAYLQTYPRCSPATIAAYGRDPKRFEEFLVSHHLPTAPEALDSRVV